MMDGQIITVHYFLPTKKRLAINANTLNALLIFLLTQANV